MAKKVFLEAYIVSIRKKGARKKNLLNLGLFNDKNSVRDAIKKYLDLYSKKSVYKIPSREKSISVKFLKEEGNYLLGTLQIGEYGYSSEILNVDTGNLSYQKKKTDTDQSPFHFEFLLPNNSKKGILLLQRFGISGVRTDISHIVDEKFKSEFPEFTLDIKPAVPSDIINKFFKNGTVEEIAFIQHSIPADKADRFAGKSKEAEGKLVLSVVPEDTGFFQKKLAGLVDIIKGSKKATDVFEMPYFQYDTIKTVVNVNGRRRTIDLSNLAKIKSSFDITDEVEKGLDGYPKPTSLQSISRELIKDLAHDAGVLT